MRRLLTALLTILAVATAAAAEDVPLPVKKPKDAKGQPITTQRPVEAAGAPAPKVPAAKASGTTTGKTPQSGEGKTKEGTVPVPAQVPAVKDAGQNAGKQDGKGAPAPGGSWPKTLEDAKGEAAAKADPKPVATEWPAEEIAAAKELCKTILEKIDAVTLPEQPFRHDDCGAPAPVRLVSIGRKPEVALSPPAVLTCGMVGALHTWLTKDLQPLAKQHLDTEVIKIESMSDYSCRNAYGRTKTKLSEHGRANALDIGSFMTAKGEKVAVLTGWGEAKRDIAARELAAKEAAAKVAAAKAAAEAAAAATAPAPADKAAPQVRDTIVEGLPKAGGGASPAPSLGVTPARLGGPEAPPPPPPRLQNFLKSAHAAACRIFGTTLGPEANNAHRNHFHVDMAPRARSNFCE
jgi:hypothetical protein